MLKGEKHKQLLISKAKELGFSSVGVSKAGFLEEEVTHLEKWLKNGFNSGMSYMENHFDKRLDPTLLVPGAKSVVSLSFNYFPSQKQNPNSPKISKYAYGEDYHDVLKDKLKELLEYLREEIGEIDGRVFTDSAPVLERAWARKSGLGWIGKNANLINKQRGSLSFLAEMIIDLELPEDGVTTDHCGACTKCIDACPTDAILDQRIIDANKCISYLTIELKSDLIPNELKGKFENWFFGCDICQDVCPWNRKATHHREDRFINKNGMLEFSHEEWHEITEDVFSNLFRKSPVKRSKFKGLKRNLNFIKKAD